jgi:hypothetical protein
MRKFLLRIGVLFCLSPLWLSESIAAENPSISFKCTGINEITHGYGTDLSQITAQIPVHVNQKRVNPNVLRTHLHGAAICKAAVT